MKREEIIKSLLHIAENSRSKGEVCRAAAEMLEQSQWISVDKRLPERDEKVLCCYHFVQYPNMQFISVLDYYARDEAPHFQHTLANENMRVTHWQHLPDAPESEEEG